MAKLNTQLQIKTGFGDSFLMDMSDNYDEIVRAKQVVDDADGFTTLVSLGGSLTGLGSSVGQKMRGAKLIVIKNNSEVPIELQLKYREWKDDSGDITNSVDLGPGSATTIRYSSTILGANEFMVLPSQWWVGYAEDASAAYSSLLDSTGYDLASTLELDSTADVDTATSSTIASDATTTRVFLEPYTSAADCTANLFRVGDLIRIENEIMEVESLGSKAGLATNFINVKRGLYGSTAATHADDTSVDFPFFNAYNKYNAYTYTQTDESGKFKCMNLLGKGRSTSYPNGIVKGSFAMKFYGNGYQELGLSGVTSGSNSGLTASTTYQFTVTADGGSAYDLSFTTDATDTSVGKVLNLIQAQFNSAYYASSGNLKNKRVSVDIVNGDIRFSSQNRTRASAIALGDSSSGGTDLWSAGIFPAVASCETAVAAVLPEDVIYDKETNIGKPNKSVFSYDDGKGNIIGGEANGTINYETGEIDFTGPPNAEFQIAANYGSAHSGGINETTDQQNVLTNISARSCNQKLEAEVEVLGFV